MTHIALDNEPSSISAVEHIASKLQKLVPYFEAGQMLSDELPCRIYRIYKYLNDLIVACLGLGLPPTVALIAKALVSPVKPAQDQTGVWTTLQRSPPALGITCIVLLLGWIAMKVFLNQNNCESRNALAQSAEKQIAVFRAELDVALQKEKPMPDLNILQGKLHELRALCITNGVWPWRPFPLTTSFQSRCRASLQLLVNHFGSGWERTEQDPNLRK